MPTKNGGRLIWYIHGASSSPLSFSWIKHQLPPHTARDITYSVDTPLAETIDILSAEAANETRPLHIISHSLGGVIAVTLARAAEHIQSVVTMSTPFGGSRVADRLRWWFPSQLFEDIHTGSRTITNLHNGDHDKPILSFVTTGGGNQLMNEPNDGVVSVESQLRLNGPRYIKLGLNHFEVLLSPEVIEHIKEFIFVSPTAK